MRILGLCDYYLGATGGGAEVVAQEVYTRLARSGDTQISVVGGRLTRDGAYGQSRLDEPSSFGAPAVDLTGILGGQFIYAPTLGTLARRVARANAFDVVHVNGLHFQSSAIGVRVARSLGIPVVATAHLADLGSFQGLAGMAARTFDRMYGGRVARSVDRVVAVSHPVAEHLISLGVEANRISVVRNGFDSARFYPRRPEGSDSPLRAVLIGRLVANKGTMDALEAVAAVRRTGRDIRLTIVGDGPLLRQAQERASRADLADAVDFTGHTTNVEDHLRRSDVSLRPSYTEGLPLAVIESLASGVPVVCTSVPGTLELVQDGQNGLVVSHGGGPAPIALAIARLHDDRGLLAKLASSAPASVAHLSWDESAKGHMAAFREVIAVAQSVESIE